MVFVVMISNVASISCGKFFCTLSVLINIVTPHPPYVFVYVLMSFLPQFVVSVILTMCCHYTPQTKFDGGYRSQSVSWLAILVCYVIYMFVEQTTTFLLWLEEIFTDIDCRKCRCARHKSCTIILRSKYYMPLNFVSLWQCGYYYDTNIAP